MEREAGRQGGREGKREGETDRESQAHWLMGTLSSLEIVRTSSKAVKESLPRSGSFSPYPRWLSVDITIRNTSAEKGCGGR